MNNARIDWDKLRVFKVVAEIGSMTAAAARLKESPPTVSRKIDELEQFLSSKLFSRSTRGMELTETGKTVLRYARQMEEAANEVLSKATGKSGGMEGIIRIGTGDGVGPYWIAPRLAEFQKDHPHAQVRMHVQEDEPDLLNGEVDIAIQFSESREPEIISHKLGTLHYIGFASQDYLDAQPTLPSSLFEYYQYRCILHESYVRQVERFAAFCAGCFRHRPGGQHDFRADPVTGQDKKRWVGHETLLGNDRQGPSLCGVKGQYCRLACGALRPARAAGLPPGHRHSSVNGSRSAPVCICEWLREDLVKRIGEHPVKKPAFGFVQNGRCRSAGRYKTADFSPPPPPAGPPADPRSAGCAASAASSDAPPARPPAGAG